ncbi:MAG: HDOD domain-containing protein [Desulfatiglandales bacterium]
MGDETKTIILLDIDEILLASFERFFRRVKREWNLIPTTSGYKALEIMAQRHVDAVVCDLRLKDMDGIAFLKEVKKRYPSVIRIVAASTPQESFSLASGGEVHQYLQKPFNSELLIKILERSFRIREVLKSQRVVEIATRITTLPSLPQLYLELVHRLNDPNVSLREIGLLIQKDPGMSAKVLQLVNSAFFGLYSKVADPIRAVTILGTETVKSLALTYGVFKQISLRKVEACNLGDFWYHNILVASLTKNIGMRECLLDTVCQNDVFTAGLLHDIGKLVFADNLLNQYSRLMRENGPPLPEKEAREFGCHHGEVGAYLLQLWGIPDKIVEAVLWHHGPLERLREAGIVPSLVWLANEIVNKVVKGDEDFGRIDNSLILDLGIEGGLGEYVEYAKRMLKGGYLEGV